MILLRVLSIVLVLLGLGAGPRLSAADPQGRYFFKTYGPEQGLMEPALATLVQDQDGFIWIASENGLLRYDGSHFRKWTTAEGLPSSFLTNLLPIPGGGLWVATDKGVVRFQGGKITPLTLDGKPFVVRGTLMTLDGAGGLWLLREDGLYRQQGDHAVTLVPGRPAGWGRALTVRPGTGSIFLAAAASLWERRADGTWLDWTGKGGLGPDGIEALAVDGAGRLWVVGTKTLFYQDLGESGFHDVSNWLPAGPFLGCVIHVNPDGSLAIPTNGGLLRIHGNEHDLVDQAQGLPCKWTVSSLVDREGNLWVVGPRIYRQLGRGYARGFTSQEGLPSDLVWSVYRDRHGRLWAGTGEGLALLGPNGWSKVPGTDGLSITSLVMDAKDRLLIGSNNQVLYCLEPNATRASDALFRSLHREQDGPGQAAPSRSSVLCLDHDGILWMGDPSHGIYRLDLDAGTLRAEYGPREAGLEVATRWLAEDRQHRLWAATTAGVVLRDGAGWHRWAKPDGLRDDTLMGLQALADGTCWLVYQEPVGITRVSWKDGQFKILEHRDHTNSLASDRVYSVGVDLQGTLWVGTDRGLDRIRPDGTYHIGQGGGMPGEDCSGNAILTEANGDVWIGTSTGLGHILAGQQPPPLAPLVVHIQQILRGKVRLTPPFTSLPPLSHRDRTLEFHFACPTYVNERAVIYQVRLVGLEEEWRASEVPQVRYSALPAGSYRFEVRAAYPGQAFGPVAAYSVEVLGPWWRSGWFISLAALTLVALVALFLNWRLRTLAAQKERLAALVDRRTADLLTANQALEQANLALKSQSLTDPLTGLHNRRFLSVVVDDDVAGTIRAYRDAAAGVALPNQDLIFLMVDLDHFKRINDQHGHSVGDKALVLVAEALRKAARETDGVIRWGGEEFLVMARNSSRAEAHLLAERIRSIMAEQELPLDNGEVLKWTCSVGFVSFPFQVEDPTWMGWERLVEIADACLYLAKKAGRNCWVGAQAGPGLDRARHGSRIPWELLELRKEGVVEMQASSQRALKSAEKSSTILG